MSERSSEAMNNDYEAGYKKPPRDSRFRKGISGNPRGRPKGKRNFATVVVEMLQEEIVIKENGKQRKVTKLEAALKRLASKAASGDLNAARLLFGLARSVEERPVESPAEDLTETDIKIMQRVMERYAKCAEGESHATQETGI